MRRATGRGASAVRRPATAPRSWRASIARLRRAALVTVAGAAVAGLAIGGFQAYSHLMAPGTFPLQAVHFDSRLEHVRESELRAALGPMLGQGFLGLDVAAVRSSLEALPWVRSAEVRRVWPGTLRINIREHRAVARWNDRALLSARGDIFAPDRLTWPDGLPDLAGPDDQALEVGHRYLEWRDTLAAAGQALEGVKLDARASWRLRLDNGALIELGRQDMEQRLERFADALKGLEREREKQLAAADLRYPNGFAIRWGTAPDGDQ